MDIQNSDYKVFLLYIKTEIVQAKNRALQSVNTELIHLYWNIGKTIWEKQEDSQWGDDVIGILSQDLLGEFGRGFSKRNLFYMKKFYLLYKDFPKVQTLSAQISWSHNQKIIDKTNYQDGKDHLRREFYIQLAIRERLSLGELEKQINASVFERWSLQQNNFRETLPDRTHDSDISMLVKDSYDFSFLNLEEPFLEKKLEDLLVLSIEKTLKNFGTYFGFVGRQVKIDIGGQSFYIDLLLYHRKLKCFVVIELKTGEFRAEYAGKMNLYLSALETQEMLQGENVPIGIILCKTKNRIIVEYALKDIQKPIGVASYITQEDLPEDLKGLLPTIQEIERELQLLE